MGEPLSLERIHALLDIWSETGSTMQFRLTGSSMAPMIQDGDLVTIQFGANRIRRGDVAVFKSGEKIVAHRVIFIQKTGNERIYLTKGDSLTKIDDPLRNGGIIGRVIAFRGKTGHGNFECIKWRIFNYLMARYACLVQPDVVGKKTSFLVNRLMEIRRKFIPKHIELKKSVIGLLSD